MWSASQIRKSHLAVHFIWRVDLSILFFRQRKERELREQQDVMTLGETREQITQLETKLQHFKEEKHQLFLQLKKVLNEDDNRRRQLQKDAK